MKAEGDENDALPSLPPELNDQLFALLFGDPARRERAFQELLAGHPDHAAALRAHWQHHGRLEQGTNAATDVGNDAAIPGYRLLAVLGEGGFGTVYLAEQKEHVRRRVALKLIKLGMDSKAVVARFALERQALAVMNHDAIAKIYDCGVTDRGQSYFVMELVEGEALTGYCDKHRLPLKDRIDLFQQVCAGIQHAHQKGVLHRDLKPGNVLVARKGEKHVAKIIDFGIARATNHQLVAQTIFTERGVMVGTPEYMSPEQACGESLQIDTRTDVYSLGVMLYELLVGELPFPSAELRKAGLLEIQRKLREDEPPKPSTKLTTRRELATEWAQKRNITVQRLHRELRGDLDWVVLKAMAKEPERRYESATALAEDLRRYLEHEPLMAGPPSAGYRLRKLVRRYRGRVVAASAVLVTAVVGAVVALQFALREQSKVREFNLLSGVVLYDQAVATEKDLYPPWPHKIEAMERWLKDDAGRLLAMKKDIEQTVQDLRSRALPQTEAEREADRRSHPQSAEFELLGNRMASLRYAQAIRGGKEKLVVPELPADVATKTADELNSMAWARVAPPVKDGKPEERTVHGEEAYGLACARAAVAKAASTPTEHQVLDTLARALLANGQDNEAKRQSALALTKAPADKQEEYRGYQREVEEAVDDAASTMKQAAEQLATLTSEVDQRRTFRFGDESQRFLHDTLSELLGKLGKLAAEQKATVEQRLSWAKRIDELTRNHPKATVTWAEAAAKIAKADGVEASEMYRKYPIPHLPQTGLVPIGMNPVTKLWEFYELRSAWDGKSDPAAIGIPKHREDGSIEVNGSTGIVFVLLPGGTFTMGSQKEDKDGANYDTQAIDVEAPTHEVTLAPFFLSRYELTQGQWLRLSGGEQPSQYKAGQSPAGERITLANPVEQVDWTMCDTLLRRHGLVLPTEAQWEYGCRAGTTTPWVCDLDDLKRYANVADATAKRAVPAWTCETWTDGHVGHAPVGQPVWSHLCVFLRGCCG